MRLGSILRRWRITGDAPIPLRELAAMMGITPATLSRFEHNKEISAASLVKILAWVLAEPITATYTAGASVNGPTSPDDVDEIGEAASA